MCKFLEKKIFFFFSWWWCWPRRPELKHQDFSKERLGNFSFRAGLWRVCSRQASRIRNVLGPPRAWVSTFFGYRGEFLAMARTCREQLYNLRLVRELPKKKIQNNNNKLVELRSTQSGEWEWWKGCTLKVFVRGFGKKGPDGNPG